ncbi:helix-turn-helix domain-containing protein [Lactobacillus sp. HT06-2]|uniref:helix-turn-helix domain-containing protein n=1 Tax=Lactobacillus sp. HT06-2 TaxID=2080222 RepID=UPI000CD88A4F|nr:helix-turn-helix transcriptional regulator [Lactobacillus sp. HT06-2]
MKNYNRTILANNIKILRKQRNLNQAELGKILHVSQQTVGSWETGRAIPGSDTLNILADYFQVSTDELLGRKVSASVSESDLDEMIDNARFFDGKPIDDHDKDLVRGILKRIYSKK